MEGEYVHTGDVTVDGNQKSGVHQLSLVVCPKIYKVSAPSQVVSQISEPSTIC